MGFLDGMIGGISGKLGGLAVGGVSTARMRGVRSTLTEAKTSLLMGGSIACTANAWTTIGSITIGKQEKRVVGYGPGDSIHNTGLFYAVLYNESSINHGWLRIIIVNAHDIVRGVSMQEVRTEDVVVTSSDRGTGFLLGEIGVAARSDDKIFLQYKPDSSTTLSDGDEGTAKSVWLVPTTLYSEG